MAVPILSLLLAIALSGVQTAVPAAMPDASDIVVKVSRDGDTFDVAVEMIVDATPEQAFAVLTDYDAMARFVTNVTASRIVRRDGEKLEVEQKSRLAIGPFHLDFVTLREVVPVPFREIRSRVIGGDMEGSTFTTTLAAHGPHTLVGYSGTFRPNRWIPPIVGPAVLEAETRKQFQEFRLEILRRRGAVVASAR